MPPVVTPRQTPTGIKLDDGYQTLIANSVDPDCAFWEKTVKPPGFDGGDMIDTTTMHNVRYRTMSPRALITMTESSVVAAYDPVLYTAILVLLNVECSWTIHFPDATALAFFAALRLFDPQDNAEGEQPTANITVSPTNQDPATGAEADPVLVNVPGT